MKRGTISKKNSRLLNFLADEPLEAAMEMAVEIEDTDRSKFIRNAIRDRLVAIGIRPQKCGEAGRR